MLRIFMYRVLRRIFGPSWDEITGEWRKLHKSVLLTQYFAGDKIEKMRWAGHVVRMEGRGVYRV
jgi:hypothetical protein